MKGIKKLLKGEKMTNLKNIENLPFTDRAKAFKEEVENAAKKYMIKIKIGWLWTTDDDQLIIENCKEPYEEVYYDTLTDHDIRYYKYGPNPYLVK